jgi:hypothetical protein
MPLPSLLSLYDESALTIISNPFPILFEISLLEFDKIEDYDDDDTALSRSLLIVFDNSSDLSRYSAP